MSYYFVIVGTSDNPLYEANLSSKPASSGPSSFFSSSSSSSNANSSSNSSNVRAPDASSYNRSSTDSGFGLGGGVRGGSSGGSASGGGVFGFGSALGVLANGLGGSLRDSASSTSVASSMANSSGAAGAAAAAVKKGLGFGRYDERHVLQMIAHSSLDAVEDRQFTNQAMYLKAVDRINEWTTSAFVIPGNVKFLILHEHKHDEGIRNFFLDVWELFVKTLLNPFHELNAPIRSPAFDAKVKASARKHL